MDRKAEVKKERRRRNSDALQGKRRRLSVNESALDRDKYEYRWANDEGNRIFDLTEQDDWEVVPDRDGKVRAQTQGDGAKVSVPTGTGEKGATIHSVLLRKPRNYYNDDYRASQARIDDTESAMKQGVAPGADQHGHEYTPKEGISLSHSSQL